jgi:hypothetical protein
MPKVNLKTHLKKIMLLLSLYCHVFSVGMKLMSDFRLVCPNGHFSKLIIALKKYKLPAEKFFV